MVTTLYSSIYYNNILDNIYTMINMNFKKKYLYVSIQYMYK